MDELLPIRADLRLGDLRALYSGWLLAVQNDAGDDEQPEPPLPAGLRSLSGPLKSLTRFLGLERDSLAAATKFSASLEVSAPPKDALSRWISSLPELQKNMVLLQAASGEDPHGIAGLVSRFERECLRMEASAPLPHRTAGELRAAADQRAKDQERREEVRLRLEQERQEKEKAAARARHLDALEEREAEAWGQVDRLVATKRPKDYDSAVNLLVDLRDLAERKGASADLRERLLALRAHHAAKPSFLRRLSAVWLEK